VLNSTRGIYSDVEKKVVYIYAPNNQKIILMLRLKVEALTSDWRAINLKEQMLNVKQSTFFFSSKITDKIKRNKNQPQHSSKIHSTLPTIREPAQVTSRS
jgi:hypothetical protein